MSSCKTLLDALRAGSHDQVLAALYALDGGQDSLGRARDRACHVVQSFLEAFSPAEDAPAALFSGPGRTEIGGNHTDHQHGRVLCGSVDLDMLACAAPNGKPVIRIQSEGYPALEIGLDDLSVREEEKNTSAAYETLVGNIFNHFCCGGTLDPVTIAKIGQYAENVYFGKPCGLMDQMGSSVGGAVFIDFNDPANPVVERIDYDFSRSGHVLCIVDTASSHGDLTDDYAAVTREMGAVAAHFGKTVLRDVPLKDFHAAVPALRQEYGDRAVLRAMHFYGDDLRAAQEAGALKQGNFEAFLNMVNASGRSSSLCLQNTWSIHNPKQQAIPLALTVGEHLLDGMGAIRVHGGGFAGTVQAWVPEEYLTVFKNGIEELFGSGKCHVLHIRPQGGCVVAE